MKKVFGLSLLFGVLLLSISLARAAGGHWDFAGWYGGGCYPNLEFDPLVKNRVYLTSDVAGIWRSDDLGEHWYFINNGLGRLLVTQVAVSPSKGNVLYAATDAGVFYSSDAGDHWQKTNNNGKIKFSRPNNYRSLSIDPQDPDHVCAGTSKGEIYCTSDHGNNWKNIAVEGIAIASKKPVPAVYLNPNGSLTVGFSTVLAKYDFKTSKWQSLGDFKNITDVILDNNTIYVASENKVWFKKEPDTGWSTFSAISRGDVFRIAIGHDNDKLTVYANWSKRIGAVGF